MTEWFNILMLWSGNYIYWCCVFDVSQHQQYELEPFGLRWHQRNLNFKLVLKIVRNYKMPIFETVLVTFTQKHTICALENCKFILNSVYRRAKRQCCSTVCLFLLCGFRCALRAKLLIYYKWVLINTMTIWMTTKLWARCCHRMRLGY